MKTEKKNLTYFEIFPNAKFEITASNGKNTPINTNPKQIQTIIRSIFQLDYPPPFIQIQHSALAEKVIVLIFDGLDVSRYIKYKEYLPNFVQLTVPQFPIFVEAMEKDGFVVGGIKTLLGIQQPKTIPKQYANFEEMLLTDQQLIENGYPFKKEGVDVSQYEYYNAYNKQLTEEDLKSYSELPDKEEGVEKEKIIAIDAEMIDTSVGNELARLSATNIKGVNKRFFQEDIAMKDKKGTYCISLASEEGFDKEFLLDRVLELDKENGAMAIEFLKKNKECNFDKILNYILEKDSTGRYIIEFSNLTNGYKSDNVLEHLLSIDNDGKLIFLFGLTVENSNTIRIKDKIESFNTPELFSNLFTANISSKNKELFINQIKKIDPNKNIINLIIENRAQKLNSEDIQNLKSYL